MISAILINSKDTMKHLEIEIPICDMLESTKEVIYDFKNSLIGL